MTKKIVVLSGVNLMDGGPLSVYRDALDGLASSPYASQYDIKALVHKRELFSEYCDIFDVIEFPDSKSSWLKRFRDEDVFWWISMHDISPRVHAENQAVYCHNSTPFLKMDLREARFGRKEYLFSKFYKYLYALNIHSNRYVVVQQEWLRKEFCRMYNLDNVLVASPSSTQLEVALQECETKNGSIFRLCYPALPRVYKNFEIVGDACTILEEQGVEGFEIALTLDGTESDYSQHIIDKYGHLKSINFLGLLERDEVYDLYSRSDCLLFPSKLESWGLPISEFSQTGKPMLLADLPYAHETAAECDKCAFFDPNSAEELASLIQSLIAGRKIQWRQVEPVSSEGMRVESWTQLFDLLLGCAE